MSERKAPYGTTEAIPVALAIRTFRLPLPPVSKNHSRTRARNGELVKLDSVKLWERNCQLITEGWQPERIPLSVNVILEYPRNKMHVWDIDGRLSMLLDTLGCHRDQWIDELHVYKEEGDGWADITIMLRR